LTVCPAASVRGRQWRLPWPRRFFILSPSTSNVPATATRNSGAFAVELASDPGFPPPSNASLDAHDRPEIPEPGASLSMPLARATTRLRVERKKSGRNPAGRETERGAGKHPGSHRLRRARPPLHRWMRYNASLLLPPGANGSEKDHVISRAATHVRQSRTRARHDQPQRGRACWTGPAAPRSWRRRGQSAPAAPGRRSSEREAPL